MMMPEILLFLTAVGLVLVEMRRSPDNLQLPFFVGAAGLSAALISTILLSQNMVSHQVSKILVNDPVSLYFKLIFVFSALMVMILGRVSHEIKSSEKTEFYTLIILSTLASCLLTSTVHLLVIYIAFEMVTFIACMLAAFGLKSAVSSEAAIKSIIYYGLTSLLFAFGIVMLFNITQNFNINEIHKFLEKETVSQMYIWTSFGLIFVALTARMSVFPFQLLGPDVIEGAPTPVAAYTVVGPALVGVVLLLRFCFHVFSTKVDTGFVHWVPMAGLNWSEFLAIICAVTMTIANLTALHQKNLKRLLGYSTTAQISYLFLGFVVLNQIGLGSFLFNIALFSIATIGAFLVIQRAMDHYGKEDDSALSGLVWKQPFEAVALSIFILSLAGLPPIAGFIGRTYLISAVMRQQIYWLAIVVAINMVISFIYYFRLLSILVSPVSSRDLGKEKEVEAPIILYVSHIALGVLLLPTVVLGVYWNPVLKYISNSLTKILW